MGSTWRFKKGRPSQPRAHWNECHILRIFHLPFVFKVFCKHQRWQQHSVLYFFFCKLLVLFLNPMWTKPSICLFLSLCLPSSSYMWEVAQICQHWWVKFSVFTPNTLYQKHVQYSCEMRERKREWLIGVDNFASMCHIMNENVYLNQKLEQLWLTRGSSASVSPFGLGRGEMFCTLILGIDIDWLRVSASLRTTGISPTVFTADSFCHPSSSATHTSLGNINPTSELWLPPHTHTCITFDTLVGFCCPSPGHSMWHWMPQQIVFKVVYASCLQSMWVRQFVSVRNWQ